MVNYPDLSSLQNDSGIGELLSIPNASYPYFWMWIFAGIWFILTSTLYFKEKERVGRGKLLASMSVSCFVIIILSVIGSIVGFIQLEILVYILVVCFIIIGIWFFSTYQ